MKYKGINKAGRIAFVDVPDKPGFPKVYQWDFEDEVIGGPDGIATRPVKELTERTEHLKIELEELKKHGIGSGSGDGSGNTGGGTAPDVPVLTGIKIKSPPAKTSFLVDEKFDPTGLVVTGVISDGSIENIPAEIPPVDGSTGFILSEPDMSTAGEKEVIVKYKGFTAVFIITVARPLTEFERFIKGFMRQPSIEVVFTYTNGPTHGRGNSAFYGGVLLPDARVVLVPNDSANIGIYDPVANTYTNGPAHGRVAGAFVGGVLLPDGRVVLVPNSSPNIGALLMPGLETGLQYCLHRFINKF